QILFMSHGLDRIESSGLDGREHSEDDADAGAEREGEHDGPRGDLGVFELHAGDGLEGDRERLSDDEPDEAADDAEDDGLDEELEQDDARARADGLAEADLAGAFAD